MHKLSSAFVEYRQQTFVKQNFAINQTQQAFFPIKDLCPPFLHSITALPFPPLLTKIHPVPQLMLRVRKSHIAVPVHPCKGSTLMVLYREARFKNRLQTACLQSNPEQNTHGCGRLSCHRCYRNLGRMPPLLQKPYVGSRACPYGHALQTT